MSNWPLDKPDSAQPQRQRAEVRAEHIMRLIWGSYAVVLVLTLVYQTFTRLQECTAAAACAISLGKAVLWSIAWPFYWMFYLNL